MSESIPPALQPPVAVALAKLVKTFPGPGALPGVMYSEPRWDGYRTIALINFDGVTLWSRQGKELTRILPDLAAALGAQVPPGVVLDGEAVIWNRDRLDFEALQRRMVTSRAALPALVKKFPAAFAAFDVLAVAGQDVRGVPFAGSCSKNWPGNGPPRWPSPPPPQTRNWQRPGYGIFPPPGLKGWFLIPY